MSKKRRKTKQEPQPKFTGIKVEPPIPNKTVNQLIEEELNRREALVKRIAALPKPKRISKTISWPRTWWDHVKQDLLPVCVKMHWPVQFDEHTYWEEISEDAGATIRQPALNTPAQELVSITLGPNADDNMALITSQ